MLFQARFRVYGLVRAVFPENYDESLDLAHVFSGGVVVSVSDQHFGVGSNLLLPGRGKNCLDISFIALIVFQERIWETVGKPSAVEQRVTRIGSSSSCTSSVIDIIATVFNLSSVVPRVSWKVPRSIRHISRAISPRAASYTHCSLRR